MLDEELKQVQKKYTTWKEVDRASQNGDKLTLDYSGEVDGVKFDGGLLKINNLNLVVIHLFWLKIS